MNAKKFACLASFAVAFAFSPALQAHQTQYQFETIDIPGSADAQAFDVNSNSRIVGIFVADTPVTHGFIDDAGTIPSSTFPTASAPMHSESTTSRRSSASISIPIPWRTVFWTIRAISRTSTIPARSFPSRST